MISKTYLFFLIHKFNLMIIKSIKKIFIDSLSFIFICSIILSNLSPPSVAASTIENNKLIDRISKDFSKKFCNSLAFGLSKDSSLIFANKENNLIFREKKGIDKLDNELLANRISTSTIESCGYLIDLYGEEGVKEFKKEYISLNNKDSDDK